eukprot:14547043-Heterocapsa_arctica.AAC.1
MPPNAFSSKPGKPSQPGLVKVLAQQLGRSLKQLHLYATIISKGKRVGHGPAQSLERKPHGSKRARNLSPCSGQGHDHGPPMGS